MAREKVEQLGEELEEAWKEAARYVHEIDQVEPAGANSGSGFPALFHLNKRNRPLDLFSSSSPL